MLKNSAPIVPNSTTRRRKQGREANASPTRNSSLRRPAWRVRKLSDRVATACTDRGGAGRCCSGGGGRASPPLRNEKLHRKNPSLSRPVDRPLFSLLRAPGSLEIYRERDRWKKVFSKNDRFGSKRHESVAEICLHGLTPQLRSLSAIYFLNPFIILFLVYQLTYQTISNNGF